MAPETSNLGRRNFLQITGAGIVAAGAGATAVHASASNLSADSESSAGIVAQPSPEFGPDLTTADIMVEALIAWGATHCFGVVGDGINSIIETLRKRQDRIKYIGVRHEEAAAFMASGFAKHTGQLGSASPPQARARFTFSTVFATQTWTERPLSRLPA
jgi:pyruvate dehydrogenase (quinone)